MHCVMVVHGVMKNKHGLWPDAHYPRAATLYSAVMPSSEGTVNGKAGQDQDHGIDTGPDEGHPSAHLKVAGLVDATQQTADNGAGKHSLNGAEGCKQREDEPDELPVARLNDAGPQGDDEVNAADEEQGPVDGEAQDVRWVVEVEGGGGAAGQGPVERGEGGGGVVERGCAGEALDEAAWGRGVRAGEQSGVWVGVRVGARYLIEVWM